jgi:SAM-dependent methyltransferase
VLANPDPALVDELERRVAVLRGFFDLSRLDGSGDTPAKVRRYYEDSRIGYRHVHSKDGAMHMALNPDGRFDPAGYEAQPGLVAQRFAATTTDVLELACGNGYNGALLARRWPDKRFLGVDLSPAQVDRANDALADRSNARAVVGDFQRLALDDASQDCIFVVESFCHATDLPRAFAEAKRVLRPGGRFVVIDAWRTDAFADLPAGVRAAAQSVERGMAVADAQELAVWKRLARAGGLRVTEDLDLTEQIVANITRLARIVDEQFLSHRVRARLLQKVLPESLLLNAVSGYLMPLTVAAGAHTYRLLMLEHA